MLPLCCRLAATMPQNFAPTPVYCRSMSAYSFLFCFWTAGVAVAFCLPDKAHTSDFCQDRCVVHMSTFLCSFIFIFDIWPRCCLVPATTRLNFATIAVWCICQTFLSSFGFISNIVPMCCRVSATTRQSIAAIAVCPIQWLCVFFTIIFSMLRLSRLSCCGHDASEFCPPLLCTLQVCQHPFIFMRV